MKKALLLLVLFPLFFSCNKNNDEEITSIINPENSLFRVSAVSSAFPPEFFLI